MKRQKQEVAPVSEETYRPDLSPVKAECPECGKKFLIRGRQSVVVDTKIFKPCSLDCVGN